MNRRTFLATSAIALSSRSFLRGQQSSSAKLDRLSLMSIAWNAMLKLPGYTAKSDHSLDILDVPTMFADYYGIHSIELQYQHLPIADPAVLAQFLANVKKAHSQIKQINVENSIFMTDPDPARRDTLVASHMQWIDHTAAIGCPRMMVYQGRPLTDDTLTYVIPAIKKLADYARTKNVRLCMETRTPPLPRRDWRTYKVTYGPEVQSPPPAWVKSADTHAAWQLGIPFAIPASAEPSVSPAASITPPNGQDYMLGKLCKATGAYLNIDVGGMTVETNQDMEDGARMLLPLTSGAVHINYRANPGWDLPTVIRTFGKLGYKGQFTIECENAPDPYAAVAGLREVILENI